MSQPLTDPFQDETPDARAARLTWERARLDEAEQDIVTGRVISGEAAIDWLDRWAAGEDLDEPTST